MTPAHHELRRALGHLARRDPAVALQLEQAGWPEPRVRPRGMATLLRTIVGQQVSVAAADAIWRRLAEALDGANDPARLAAASDASLRACGLSRMKIAYAHSLSAHLLDGRLVLGALPADDEEAVQALTRVSGIGRWSAEIYLMFAEQRPDIWPAGDLAVREGMRRILALEERPSERAVRQMGPRWSPHRSALALLAWHVYAAPPLR
ncbi:DNA-3-methyladenine glycosylase family protein [Qipengyuania thermophila]|uniref:DNA-3-methyladenine glycosylase family protein n=1 Tax=Qipengyuania thermophila TaxID=2509361 RepID=UPI001F37252F|nr:DNA-3-methyladenine glycosylase 2 family protein [Qipengyuania thermophila]